VRQETIREGWRGVKVPHHVRLLNGQDRGRSHGHRRRHPLHLARQAALAEEMADLEEGDYRLFACMRQDGQPDGTVSTYMTLGAGSPWAKIVPAGSYSRRCSRTPVQSTASMGLSAGGVFDLLIARRCTALGEPAPS
jgi:hypothetical protein